MGGAVYLDTETAVHVFRHTDRQTDRRHVQLFRPEAIEAANALNNTRHEYCSLGKVNKDEVSFISLVNVCTQGIHEGFTLQRGDVCVCASSDE